MNAQYFASMPERLDEYFARRLRELRGELTQEQWEERTQIPQTTLSRWESIEGWGRMKNVDERFRAAGIDPFVLINAPQRVEMEPRVARIVKAIEAVDAESRGLLLDALEAMVRVRAADPDESRVAGKRIGGKS